MSLYEISRDLESVLMQLDDGDGEVTPELAALLDGLEGEFAAKVDQILRYRADQLAASAGIVEEIHRLKQLLYSYERKAEGLERYVKDAMERAGNRKLQTRLFKVWVQNSPPSAKLAVGAMIPTRYTRTRLEFDARAALEDHKAGVPLPPDVVVVRGTHLVVK